MTTQTANFKCALCGYISPNLMFYVSHLRIVHVTDESFHVVCGIGNCDKEYTAFAAYSSHIYRHHRVALGLDSGALNMVPCHETGSSDDIFHSESSVLGNDDIDDDNANVVSLAPSPTQAAKFLLQLREGYRVSQVALLSIMHTCNEMCIQAGNGVKQEIKDRLAKANICTDVIDDITVPHPFEGVNTIYLFEKYCVEHFNYLVSCFFSSTDRGCMHDWPLN